MSTQSRALIIQLERLGDLIQTTPLCLDLAAQGTSYDLILLEGFAPLVASLPGLVRCIELPRQSVAQLNHAFHQGRTTGDLTAVLPQAADFLATILAEHGNYDLVFNASHGEFASWLALQFEALRHSGGMLFDNGEWLYQGTAHVYLLAMLDFRSLNRLNLVDLYRAEVRPACRCDASARPHVALADSAGLPLPRPPFVVLNPGSNDVNRRWPVARYRQLARQLLDKSYPVVVIGGPGDRELCAEVAAENGVVDACAADLSVLAMNRVLADAACLITNDTGAAHLAAAVGTTVVGIYGGASVIHETAPWGAGHLLLQAPGEAAASDLEQIDVELVGRLADGLLRQDDQQIIEVGRHAELYRTTMIEHPADPLGGLAVERVGQELDDALPRAFRRALAQLLTDQYRPSAREISSTGEKLLAQFAPTIEALHLLAEQSYVACRAAASVRGAKSAQLAAAEVEQGWAALSQKSVGHPVGDAVVGLLGWRLRNLLPVSAGETLRAHALLFSQTIQLIEATATGLSSLSAQ